MRLSQSKKRRRRLDPTRKKEGDVNAHDKENAEGPNAFDFNVVGRKFHFDCFHRRIFIRRVPKIYFD